jgi:hypothetical protein
MNTNDPTPFVSLFLTTLKSSTSRASSEENCHVGLILWNFLALRVFARSSQFRNGHVTTVCSEVGFPHDRLGQRSHYEKERNMTTASLEMTKVSILRSAFADTNMHKSRSVYF